MIVSFNSKDVHDCCCDFEIAEANLGSINARALVTILADIEALENAGELLDFFGEDSAYTANEILCVVIGSEYDVKLAAVGNRFVQDEEHRTDWGSVTRLKVVEILKCQ